jgi:hypothetical protein
VIQLQSRQTVGRRFSPPAILDWRFGGQNDRPTVTARAFLSLKNRCSHGVIHLVIERLRRPKGICHESVHQA